MFNPDVGFTEGVIKDPSRFVGRLGLIETAIDAINKRDGLIAIFGKRGVGKSSLMRQVQQMSLGDYKLAKDAGLARLIPRKSRSYLTVYYQCDSGVDGALGLISRLINDQDGEDGLLRLVPNDGKELVEFTRSYEDGVGIDLKVAKWGDKGVESSKYAKTIPSDPVQTFRNYVSAIITHQVKPRKLDGLLIMIDEFDVIKNRDGIGSLIKALSSENVKFCVCGVSRDISSLISDHASVQRLIGDSALIVSKMSEAESTAIVDRACELYDGKIKFTREATNTIVATSGGYPYMVQMIGRECVKEVNRRGASVVDNNEINTVLDNIKHGSCLAGLESMYQRAIGHSEPRRILLALLAEQEEELSILPEDIGRIQLRKIRRAAEGLDIANIGQLIPRLLDKAFGPILEKVPEKEGVYEFINPVMRLYCRMRAL